MAEIVHLTDENFEEEVRKDQLVLVDFWAVWCAPCKIIEPVIEELAQEYAGRLTCGKLNVDENPVTAARFQIMSIPSILLFKGGEVVDKLIGAVPKSQLEDKINTHIR